MEFLSSIIIEIVKGLWRPIGRQIKYLVQYNENIESFRSQVSKLEKKKIDLLDSVERSERQLEKRTEEVKSWLEKADHVIENARKRIEGEVGKNKRWLFGLIPNWSSRYKLSTEATKVSEVIDSLLEEGEFTRVSHPSPPPSVIPFAMDDFVDSETMENALEEVMQALKDENITTIGVHGPGGVGKTTLMKKLNNELQTSPIFKIVIMVTVSSNPDLGRIQNEIAHSLGLELGSEISERERVHKLSLRIMAEEGNILIILDDLWKELVLSDVGIPKTGSRVKIIITSRNLDVCHQMQTQKNIKMKLLSDEESWNLFKEKAGSVVDSPALNSLAEQVMKECGGLPLAITAVGLTLRMEESVNSCNDALRSLKISAPVKVEGGDYIVDMIKTLKFSYDRLKNDDAKQCFLLCSLFPEDENIDISDLLWYAFGEGFLEVEGVGEAKNGVYALVERLKNCGLLLEGDTLDSIKMHDVVRDVAITIAEQHTYKTKVKARSGLKEWPQIDNMEQCKRISLMSNSIEKLPDDVLLCPNLRTLLLRSSLSFSCNIIPSNFFECMSSLVVLDLSDTPISSLPPSLKYLVNPRTLLLGRCRMLTDVSLVGSLKNLQVLSIKGYAAITEFPTTFSELSQLKVLDLEDLRLKAIPSGIFSKFSRLEILRIDLVDEGSWTEIASLPSLTEVYVGLLTKKCLFQEVPDENPDWAKKLKRFHISIGRELFRDQVFKASKRSTTSMVLAMLSPNQLANWFIVLLKRTETLILEGCNGIRSMEDQELVASSNCLKFLILRNCLDMQYLIDFTTTSSAPAQYLFGNVQFLALTCMPKLKKICHGSRLLIPGSQCFENQGALKRPERYHCNNSHMVFSSYEEPLTAFKRVLQCQQHDIIHECENYDCDEHESEELDDALADTKIDEQNNDDDDDDNNEEVTKVYGPPIFHLENRFILPWVRDVTNEELRDALMEIPRDGDQEQTMAGHECLNNPVRPAFVDKLQRLQILVIFGCNELENLFSLCFALNHLNQLRTLNVRDCSKLVALMGEEEEEEDNSDETELATTYKGVLPRLKNLTLEHLPNLTSFSHPRRGHLYFDFLSLHIIKIINCPKISALPFDSNTAPNLQGFDCFRFWFDELEWKDKGIKSRFFRAAGASTFSSSPSSSSSD